MLTTQDIERLIMLVTVADYQGDTELRRKLEVLLKRERARAELNQHPI